MSDTKIVYSTEKFRQGVVTEVAIDSSSIEFTSDKRIAFSALTLRGRYITVDVLAENTVHKVSGKFFTSYDRAIEEAKILARREACELTKKLTKLQKNLGKLESLAKKNINA